MENTKQTTLNALILKALRPSIENKVGIELRKKVLELGGTDLLQYSLKQLLLFKDMIDHDLSSNSFMFLKKGVKEKEIESCIKIASNQPATVSIKILHKVLNACPTNTWFKPRDISIRTEDSGRGLNALFIIGQLQKRGEGDGKEYYLKGEDVVQSNKERYLNKDSSSVRLLKVLQRLESFGNSGTRQGVQVFLREHKCPSYTKLSKVLVDSGHIIKDTNRKVIFWNSDRVGKPNLSMAKEILKRGSSLGKKNLEDTYKSKIKKVSKRNLLHFLYELATIEEVVSGEDLKNKVSEFVKDENMTNEFKEFYIGKELGDKLNFLN